MRGIVWFKKDLRVCDHESLFRASHECSELIAIYVYEDEWFKSYEFDQSHLNFVNQSLYELEIKLLKFNIKLHRFHGDIISSLKKISSMYAFTKIYAHEETGVDWTFKRDKRVKLWVKENSIHFIECRQFGVVRKLNNRDEWIGERNKILQRPLWPLPRQMSKRVSISDDAPILEKEKTNKVINLRGGTEEGNLILESFFEKRSKKYLENISSPWFSVESSSRVSPYLTFGNLSLTQVFHQLEIEKRKKSHDKFWLRSLEAFESRLWWHCHFIQKFESESDLEFKNTNREFDGMREDNFNHAYFEAWKKGETGIPMIDASMRCLLKHSWLNFRMRAMLISFSSYQLWLHWKKPADFLAKHFLDFEPGIHFPQIQMQSGVTGINTIRIYSPTKQATDQKGGAEFIKHFCPELKVLPDEFVHDPQSMPPLLAMSYDFKLGTDYPYPILDEKKAYHSAKDKIFEWKNKPQVILEAQSVLHKHGSRRSRN